MCSCLYRWDTSTLVGMTCPSYGILRVRLRFPQDDVHAPSCCAVATGDDCRNIPDGMLRHVEPSQQSTIVETSPMVCTAIVPLPMGSLDLARDDVPLPKGSFESACASLGMTCSVMLSSRNRRRLSKHPLWYAPSCWAGTLRRLCGNTVPLIPSRGAITCGYTFI